MSTNSFAKGMYKAIVFISLIVMFITGNSAGCIKEDDDNSNSGCGTVMGCCPATGCGNKWFGASTRLCYNTSTDCHNAGNSNCRQCY